MPIVALPLASRPLLMGQKKNLDTDQEQPDPALLAKKPTPPPGANTPPPVAKPSAAQNSAAAAQLATLPTWLKGLPAQHPASSGAANSPLIPLRPDAPANNAAPKPTVIPLRPEAASAGKAAQQQTPTAPPAGQQPAAAPQPNGTPPPAASATPATPAGRAAGAAPQAQPRGISANPRGDGAAKVKIQGDIAAGKVIKDGKVLQHPDKSGDLYQPGFTQPTFTDDAKKGTTIPYRDDHGKVYHIGVHDMRRTTDSAGNASYSFQVNGKNVSMPEDSKSPLFQIDPKDGRRFTTAADGTRRELGYDRNTAAQAGIAPREQARNQAREKLLTQGADLSRQLTEKQSQASAAQQRLDAAQQKYHNPGNATDAERQANFNELMGAMNAHTKLTSEVQTLQQQHDDHYQNLVRDQRARQAEIDQHKAAAAEHPQDEQWRKDSRHTQGDTRHTDAALIAEAEKKDPATAAAMRRALTSQPAQRALAAAQSAFGTGTGGSTATGQPAGAGQSMTLHAMLMHAPEMKQGGYSTVNQADAARATAQGTFGITDPENVHVTPNASGGYSLSRKTDGGGPGQPFATMDGQTGHITLLPGADGRYSQAAQDLAASSTPGSAPIYLGRGTPLTEAERSALIAKGQQATSAAKDRQGADAALTQAGLSPEGIQKMRNEGLLSVQDAKFLNDKFNSGVGSYAQREALQTAQKQSAGLQQMYQDTKAPADKPNFKSWQEKGDPQRDAQVQATAKELGLSEDDVRRTMEDQRRMDFATPLTQEGHDQQSGMANAFLRGSGFSGHDQDTTRTLTDGSLAVNPSLTDDKAKFEKAIQESKASPEAKAAALKSWPAQHDAWLTRATETLKASKTLPGVEDYNEWLTKNTQAGHFTQKMPDGSVRQYTDNEKTQLYLDAMQNRSGVRKFMDNVSTSLVSGGGQVVSGLLGAAALAGNTFQDITGVNVGGEAASEAAAAMARQNQGLTQSNEMTGTTQGKVGSFLSNLIQAVPSVGAAIATGGTAGLILGAAQSAGSTYTDLLEHHIKAGDTIEEAHKKAAGTAIASGGVGLVLSKIMPGGAQALNNPATRELAKKSFAATVKSALHGASEETIQEAIEGGFTHIASEMNKGKTFNEAATSFAEQFPQNALTSALLGGGVQAMADKKNSSAPPQPATAPQQSTPQQPAQVAQPAPSQQTSPAEQPAPANPPAPSPQHPIPQPTTPDTPASGSGQQPQTTANNRQQQQTPPSGQPSSTPPSPASPQHSIPDTATQNASGPAQQPQTTANDRKPPQAPPTPPLPPPTTAPKSPEQSQRLVNNVMNRPPEQRGHPQVQSDVAQARDVLHDHVQKLENQKEPLSEAQKKELADAKAALSRLPAEKPANTPGSGPPTDTQPAAHTQSPETAPRPADAARPSEATPENVQHPESANRPQPEAPESAPRPHGEADPHTPPPSVDPNRTPHADTAAEAPLSRRDTDGWTPHADTHPNDARPGRKLPANAEPPPRGHGSSDSPQSGRNRPDGRPLEPSYPTPERDSRTAGNVADTTPYHPATSADSANATNPQTADRPTNRNAPDQVQNTSANPSPRPTDNSHPPSPNTSGPPPAATANGSPPSSLSRTSLPPPRTPPLSPEQSRRLLDNVAKMPEKAQQHPQVQADVAQARSVVAKATAHSIQFEAPPPSASSHGAPSSGSGKASPSTTSLAQPALPAITGRIGNIETRLQSMAAEWNELRQDYETAQSNENAAAINGTNAEYLQARKAQIKAKNVLNQMIENARREVEIPQHERGQVAFGSVDSRLHTTLEAGARLTTRYTHAALLPKVDVAYRSSERPAYKDGVIRMDVSAAESKIMHEITHGTEEKNPAVLAAALAFLRYRAGTEQPKRLRDLTGREDYRLDEYAYEDQFAARGGDHYMGKDYGGRGTELLTRGIERLHANPVEFMQNDPEYFRFILQTLQHP